jgi:hypothetical protein
LRAGVGPCILAIEMPANYYGILGHCPGYVTVRKGLVRKFDESQPRDEKGRWEGGHDTPFASTGFKHKTTGEIVKSGTFHDVFLIPGYEERGAEVLGEYESGFLKHDGTFLNRVDAADYAAGRTKPLPDPAGLDSTEVPWEGGWAEASRALARGSERRHQYERNRWERKERDRWA